MVDQLTRPPRQIDLPHESLCGVNVHAIGLRESARLALNWIESRQKHYICFCNIRSIARAGSHSEVRAAFQHAALAAPDGMPLVWILRLLGFRSAERVYGPDFVNTFAELSQRNECRHAFYGGKPGVAIKFAQRLKHRYPRIQIAGVWSPPRGELSEQEQGRYLEEINASHADILWVGLGAPRQELWISRYRPQLNTPVIAGVGYAFDVHSGEARQAPLWLRQFGLEWAYRSLQRPSRIWSHLIVDGSAFALIALRCLLRRRM